MKPHISIAQLLLLTVPVAFAFAAIANPSAFWEGTVFVLTLILWFTAIVGVVYRKGRERAFWLGFSIFGWGFTLLCSDISFEFRSPSRAGSTNSRLYWANADEEEHPVRAFTRSVVDALQLERRIRPKAVGEKIQVQWGAPSSYYPSSVLAIKDGQYRIRYDSDPQGGFDEWVGTNRIKLIGGERIYRIAESLFALLFALTGAVIALYFHATRKPNDSDGQSLIHAAPSDSGRRSPD